MCACVYIKLVVFLCFLDIYIYIYLRNKHTHHKKKKDEKKILTQRHTKKSTHKS